MYKDLIAQLRATESRSKRNLLDRAAAAIERLSVDVTWARVEDELPSNPNEQVLVVVNGEHKGKCFFNALLLGTYYHKEGWILEMFPEWENPIVTHWLPLPEPPKEVHHGK